MTAPLLAEAAPWIALVLTLGAVAASVGAATTRSLFAMGMYVSAAGAMAAAALLAHGESDAALAAALIAVGVAPFVTLATVVLSARAAKPRRRGRPWLTIAAACAAMGAMLWALPDLGTARVTPAEPVSIAFWLGPLVFVGAAACFALIGFGERGAFEPLSDVRA